MWREGEQVLETINLTNGGFPTPEEMFERKLELYSNAGEPLSENEKQLLRGLFAAVYNEAQTHEN